MNRVSKPPAEVATASPALLQVALEYWIARRLGLPLSWDTGSTTTEQRRESVRKAIKARGVADRPVPARYGEQNETYRQIFRRVYGVPLDVLDHHESGDGQ